MCGRFVQKGETQKWQDRYGVPVPAGVTLRDRYNLAPGQPAAVVVGSRAGPRLEHCVWGLVPSWAKDVRIGYKMINARVETLWEKPSFRHPLRYRRCLVPANGFYEWKSGTRRGTKTPYYFTWPAAPVFSLAGLWEVWNDGDGGECFTFTIITRAANEFMQPYHHRMPLILPPAHEAAWLDPARHQPDDLQPLLEGGVDGPLAVHPVSTRVNSVAHDDATLIQPLEELL
jgi:putative SOS response-associated peptidase YedK